MKFEQAYHRPLRMKPGWTTREFVSSFVDGWANGSMNEGIDGTNDVGDVADVFSKQSSIVI